VIARQLFTCYEQGRTPALEQSSPVGDDSNVMQREITAIPAVIRHRLGLASQAATAEGLRGRRSNISCWSVAGFELRLRGCPLWPLIGTPPSRPGGSTPSASLVTESATK